VLAAEMLNTIRRHRRYEIEMKCHVANVNNADVSTELEEGEIITSEYKEDLNGGAAYIRCMLCLIYVREWEWMLGSDALILPSTAPSILSL